MRYARGSYFAACLAGALTFGCGGAEPAPKTASTASKAAPKPTPAATVRGSECDTLIKVLNAGVDGMTPKGEVPAASEGIAQLYRMADIMEQVATEADATSITTEPLRQYALDYQRMCRDVAKAARIMAAAAESRDHDAIAEAQAAIDEAVRPEDTLVQSINGFCSGS